MKSWLYFWRVVDIFISLFVAIGFLIALLDGQIGTAILLMIYLVWTAVKDLGNRPLRINFQTDLGTEWERIFETVIKYMLASGYKITFPRQRNAKGQFKKDVVLTRRA